ncbi:MAG: hypothetical protein ACRDN0_30175 [Trebonia sp.]
MTRLLSAETLRLRTTRAYWLLAVGAMVVIAGGIAPTAATTSFTVGASAAGISGAGAAATIVGGAIATALFAALGAGTGAIIRNQAAAIVAVLALLYVAEPLLGFIPHVATAIQQYGLGGLSSAATRTTGLPGTAHLLGQAASVLVLAGYAAVVLFAAAVVLSRQDITA